MCYEQLNLDVCEVFELYSEYKATRCQSQKVSHVRLKGLMPSSLNSETSEQVCMVLEYSYCIVNSVVETNF